jgi:site-specific recombinase XerD
MGRAPARNRAAVADAAASSALVVARPPAVIRAPGIELELPAIIADAGHDATEATLEFFIARIPNPNTREAYGRAVARFCRWCDTHALALDDIAPPVVASYLEALGQELEVPSVKLHLAGLRHWLDWLAQRGVLPSNPAASVRGPRHVVREGKTPVLERSEARRLFESIPTDDVVSLRDRAMLAVMLFQFVRVGAVVKMRVKAFADDASGGTLAVREKGGKHRRIPCHHQAREYLRAYLDAAGVTTDVPAGGEAPSPDAKTPLFQSAPRWSKILSGKPMRRQDVLRMVKRRCAAAGLPASFCNHSFRGTGITIHLENGGSIEAAQDLAGHADISTTRLYDRRKRKAQRTEVERVQI